MKNTKSKFLSFQTSGKSFKKIFFGLLILMVFLVSCSSNELVNNSSQEQQLETIEQVQNETLDKVETINEAEDTTVETIQETEFEPETSKPEKFSVSSQVIEKNIENYDFEESEFLDNKNFLNYKFEAYQASYSFGTSTAFVLVLIPTNGLTVSDLLDELDANDNYEFLDNEDFNFLTGDVYFNPNDNIYTWMSKGKLIVIEKSIGIDLLTEYLEKYPVSVIKGTYEDEEVSLDFEGINDEKVLIFNNNQYVISINEFTSDEITISVNEDEKILELGDKAVVGNLLLSFESFSESNKKASISIKKEVFNFVNINLGLGETKEFELDNEQNTIQLLAVNADDISVMLAVNEKPKSLNLNEVRSFGIYEVSLINLFINTIGEETVDATIQVWVR